MATKQMYFIIDATHEDFPLAKAEAEAAQATYVDPNSVLSWSYNNDQTKVQAKVVGSGDWYPEVPWYQHPMFLGVYSKDEGDGYDSHDLFAIETAKPEWQPGIEGGSSGSPEE
jgi:hypothetical protein